MISTLDRLVDSDSFVTQKLPNTVILVADAAGFSRMCAKTVADDYGRPDAISVIVNAHISRLSQIVSEHGGVITTFSGDSIWAVWQGEKATLRERLVAATSAAQEITRRSTTAATEATMRFGCVIDHGPCDIWRIGEAGKTFTIVSGVLPERLVGLSRSLSEGRVVLSPQAHEALGDAVIGIKEARGFIVARLQDTIPHYADGGPRDITLHEAAADFLTDLPPSAQAGGWSDEICRATVLFLRFPEHLTDGPEAFASLGGMTARASKIVAYYGGYVVQAKVDDKGLVFVAAWGLAQSRSENDAARATMAAQEMVTTARAQKLAPTIGVSTGRVFAGDVGDAQFRTFAILGTAVNRAAWLMQNIDNGMIVDAATVAAASSSIGFAEVGELTFKGEEGTSPIFAPCAVQTKPQRSVGRLIGRSKELEAFSKTIIDPNRPPIWITGEAGIGKSHFLQTAISKLPEHGRVVLMGGSENLTRNQPFAAWRPILHSLLATEGEANLAQIDSYLSTRGDTGAELGSLASLLGRVDQVSPRPQSGTSNDFASGMQEQIITFLASRLRDTDTVLVFEDSHWLDTASWKLIASTQARFAKLQIVLLNRPFDVWALPLEARPLHTSATTCHIRMGPLTYDAARELICAVIEAEDVPEALAKGIESRVEGHPYYTKEMSAALLRRGTIKVRHGHCYIPNGAENLNESAFPENIESAISSRFAELPTDAQLTLKVASAIGRVFAPNDVAAVHPEAPDSTHLQRHLSAARRLDLIENAPIGANLQFHHALTRDTVHGLMTENQRKQLHRSIALVLETRAADQDLSKLAVLGHHWATAGEPEKAIYYLTGASDHAGRSQSYYEQAELLRQVMRLDAQRPVPAASSVLGQWEIRIAKAFFQLGNVTASVKHGERAISALVSKMPTNATLVPRLITELLKVKLGRPGKPPADEDERQTLLSAAQTCIELSFHTYEIGRLPLSMFLTFLAVNLARRVGTPSVPLAIGNANMSVASLSLPFLFDGRELQQQALAIAKEVGDPVGLYWIGINCSTYAFAQGELNEAIELAELSVVTAKAHLSPRDCEAATSHKANFERARGNFAEGLALDSQTLVSGRDRGAIQGRIWGLNGCCRSLLALGKTDVLRAYAGELDALLSDPGNATDLSVNNRIVLLVSRAQLALTDQIASNAIPYLKAAAETLSSQRGPQYYLEEVPSNLGDGLLRCWQLEKTTEVIRIARVNLKGARLIARTYPVGRYKPALAQGDLALFQGRPDRAARAWQTARDTAREQGLHFAQAHTEMRLALKGVGPEEQRLAANERLRSLLNQIDQPIPFHWQVMLDHAA